MSILSSPHDDRRKRLVIGSAVLLITALIALGVMAKNNWLPHTDPLTSKKTGWFGKELPKNASSSWNPLSEPPPTPTPQLSKELIWAGNGRLLAVEDANANAALPADLAIWRPSNGQWWTLNSQGGSSVYTWGLSTDLPVAGDFDGDGKTDFAVFRPSTGDWWQTYSSTGGSGVYNFGVGTDTPVQADFDGDGKTDAAVLRTNDPSSGLTTFYIRRSSDSSFYSVPFGVNTDIPAPADYDGDGRADIGVWRSSDHMFYSINSSNAAIQYISMGAGTTGNKVVSSDFDGDGHADYSVYNQSTANWYIRQSGNGQVTNPVVTNSNAADIPVQNDYDGDGKTDIAVWRDSNGHWLIDKSSGGTREEAFGQHLDIPVPAYYKR